MKAEANAQHNSAREPASSTSTLVRITVTRSSGYGCGDDRESIKHYLLKCRKWGV